MLRGKANVKSSVDASKSLVPLFFKRKSALAGPVVDDGHSEKEECVLVQSTLDSTVQKSHSVQHAEIRWALKVVMGHLSFRSCPGLNELFKCMFPDSSIAGKFKISRTKCGYIITLGMYPHFKDLLVKEINASPFLTMVFDESLNSAVQKQQMDIIIRYWCSNSNLVKASYLDSQFQYSGSANNLSLAMSESIKI